MMRSVKIKQRIINSDLKRIKGESRKRVMHKKEKSIKNC